MLTGSPGKMAGSPMPGSGSVFEFATAGRILFGEGERHKAGRLAADYGRRAMVIVGYLGEAYRQLEQDLEDAGVVYSLYEVHTEPTVEVIRRATWQARQEECELVIGFGGGSAMDTAKAVGAMLANPGEVPRLPGSHWARPPAQRAFCSCTGDPNNGRDRLGGDP